MMITDHIMNFVPSPLIGPNINELGLRFPDMSEVYKKDLQEIIRNTAKELGIKLQEGVYCGLSGPNFETPAEIHMLRILGGSAAGMSTVPEILAARQENIRILAISCISNMAAGMTGQILTHEEVFETSKKAEANFSALIRKIIKNM